MVYVALSAQPAAVRPRDRPRATRARLGRPVPVLVGFLLAGEALTGLDDPPTAEPQ